MIRENIAGCNGILFDNILKTVVEDNKTIFNIFNHFVLLRHTSTSYIQVVRGYVLKIQGVLDHIRVSIAVRGLESLTVQVPIVFDTQV